MRRIRWLAAAVVAAMLLAAGCGGDDGGTKASEPQEITVWAMGAEGEKLGTLADEFTKANPNIKVKVTPITWEVAHQKLVASVAGNQTPDVSQLGSTWMGEFAKLGALDEVPDSFSKDAFFEGAWNTNVVEGKTVGVPWYVETRALYYRTDLAEKAGAKMPPTTWPELREAATKIKKVTGKYGLALPPNTTGQWQEMLPFVWSNGGDVTDAEGNPTLDTPQVVEGLKEYSWYHQQGLSPKSVPAGYAVEKGFVAGDYGMFFSGPWHMSILNDTAPKLKGKWKVAHWPTKQTATSFVGGANLVVFNGSEHKEAAWKFVEFATNPDTQARWYKTVAALPSTKAGWERPELTSADENLKVFQAQLEDAKSPPNLATWEQLATKINTWIERVAAGKASAEDAAKGMQADAQALVKK
jgi:multiple sugar transport system substrate-binding protein